MSPQPSEETALLIDDDVELCAMLREYLSLHGWTITAVHNGYSGLQSALEQDYRIVLLDVMLPDMDGFEVLRRLRQQSAINVLLLTARGEDVDRIVGLELGADDYLAKPFNPRELVARMRAISRRGQQEGRGMKPPRQRAVGKFKIDSTLRSIFYGGKRLDLTEVEFGVLRILLERQFEVVSREELVEQVLERPFRPLDRSIDMHVSRLRKKLEGLDEFRGSIRSFRNSGYMFSPDETVS